MFMGDSHEYSFIRIFFLNTGSSAHCDKEFRLFCSDTQLDVE